MIDTGNCLKQSHTEHFKHSANTYFLGGYVKCVSDKFVYCLSTGASDSLFEFMNFNSITWHKNEIC
jgi:hypothetical protein